MNIITKQKHTQQFSTQTNPTIIFEYIIMSCEFHFYTCVIMTNVYNFIEMYYFLNGF